MLHNQSDPTSVPTAHSPCTFTKSLRTQLAVGNAKKQAAVQTMTSLESRVERRDHGKSAQTT